MNIVALTGGIGCGKSEATRVFLNLGVPVVDLDKIAHQLTSAGAPLVQTIARVFGAEFVTHDGAMDRSKMGAYVFNHPDALNTLNAILHPAIYQAAVVAFEQYKQAPYQVLDIPLLDASSQYLTHIQHVLVIDCDAKSQVKRVMQRSQLKEAEIKKIMSAQMSRSERLALANTVVKNDGNLQDLESNIVKFHKKYIKTCIVS